jgi:hypothetical protein
MSLDSKLQVIAPETKDLTSAERQELLAIASAQCNFGNTAIRELARVYLAAHIYNLSLRGGTGGAIASEKEGDLARSYTNTMSGSSLAQTTYGQEYQRLKNLSILSVQTRIRR